MKIKLTFLILCTLILTSCATLPAEQGPLNQKMSWQARQAQLQSVTAWKLEGAIAIRTPQGGQSASLTWVQTSPHHYYIDLFGPLGAGHVSLEGSAQQVTLLAEGKSTTGNSPEAVMQQVLGWQLPVSHGYDWVRGLPAKGITDAPTFDSYHHLSALEQQGWKITYAQYTGIHGIDLPSKIILQRNELKIVIVISQWQLQFD